LLAAVSGAHADLVLAEEGPPAAVAAYSAGHVAALYAARVIDRAACLRIACIRGAALAEAAARIPGGMVTVHGLPEDELALLVEEHVTDKASLAARNAPKHVVYSGDVEALSHAAARAAAAGAVTSWLDVAGPWHSPLMEGARAAIEKAIAGIAFMPACVPVWSSVTALPTLDPERLRLSLSASISCTVEWHATVDAMLDAGLDAFLEVSPGRSLWALLGQIEPAREFSRRYVECQRGPARRRKPSFVGRHTSPTEHLTKQSIA
jgi:[acyl-carrier-protein] S-malonyltransferase